VEAELFDSATIFFSDIADFHDISVNSFPIDIIHFLNELYNFMDKEIVKYDVYKVMSQVHNMYTVILQLFPVTSVKCSAIIRHYA